MCQNSYSSKLAHRPQSVAKNPTMFDNLKRMLGMLSVKILPDAIRVEGIPAQTMMRDISKVWSTSKINTHMFVEYGRSALAFPPFFAAEVVYMLRALIDHRVTWSARAMLERIIELLYTHTWLTNTRVDHPNVLNYEHLKLVRLKMLPHQLGFMEMYNRVVPAYGLRGLLLSAAPGAGKTLTCLATSLCLEADLTIIVSPKNALYRVWEETIKTQLLHRPEYWIAADGKPYTGQPYVIVHYETLQAAIDVVRWHQVQHRKLKRPVVLLDECHNLNEPDSLRTRLFLQLCRVSESQHIVFSSGTPMKALGYEAIPLLRAIDPLFTPTTEERFREIYGKSASRALDILNHRLGLVSYKVAKSVIQTDVPKEVDVRVKIPNGVEYTLDAIREEMRTFIELRMQHYLSSMKHYEAQFFEALKAYEAALRTQEQWAAYRTYRQYIEVIRKGYDPVLHKQEVIYCNNFELKVVMPLLPQPLKEQFKHARSVVKYVYLKVMGEALGSVLGKKRAKCQTDMVPHSKLIDIVNDAEKKTVIFTSYVETLHAIEEHFRQHGYTPVVVYGETNKDLSGLLANFESNPSANPLIATYPSLSTAVPLVMANVAVFTNQPFRDYEKNQAMARVDRLGQDTPVRFYNVYLDTDGVPNISTRSADILEWSRAQVTAIMGTESSPITITDVDSFYTSTESYVADLATLEQFINDLM